MERQQCLLVGSSLARELNQISPNQLVCKNHFYFQGHLTEAKITGLKNWLKQKRTYYEKIVLFHGNTMFPSRKHFTGRGEYHYCLKKVNIEIVTEMYQALMNALSLFCKAVVMIEPPPRCINRQGLLPSCFSYDEECKSRFRRIERKLFCYAQLGLKTIRKEELCNDCAYFDFSNEKWPEHDIYQLTAPDGIHLGDLPKKRLRIHIQMPLV